MKETVAVLGAGTMGQGIAQVCAQAGREVLLYDPFEEALERAQGSLEAVLRKLEAKGRLKEPARDIQNRVTFTSELADVKGSAWVIEAVPEKLELKRDLFRELDALEPDAVLATNTSTLSVTMLAGATSSPAHVLGLHFFNPAPLMKLVEVVPGMETPPELVERALTFVRALGKTPVVAQDAPGFIVNRVARPFYGEALKLAGEGIPFEAVDRIVSGLGFRMGPFELMDLIGLDVNFAATMSVYEASFYEPRYRPHPIQQRMVEAGYLGRKNGRGFYRYPREETRETPPKADPAGAPKVFVIGTGSLAEAFKAHFPVVTDPEVGDLVVDLRVSLGEKRFDLRPDTARHLPVLTLVWGHSASFARACYPGAAVAGVSFVPPLSDATVVEVYAPLSGPNTATDLAVRYFGAHGMHARAFTDTPGGVGFRILGMLVNEAASALGEGLATVADLDTAMKLGTNYPLGPLEWGEKLGLENVLAGLQGLHRDLGERYRPQPYLARTVAAGLTKWRRE